MRESMFENEYNTILKKRGIFFFFTLVATLGNQKLKAGTAASYLMIGRVTQRALKAQELSFAEV
jgi:hypothetical protein